jgi:RNA polymerase sigma factor (sigma-70 family)
MTALPDWDIAGDAQLAGAAAAGDRGAFAAIYDRYADRLHDFCIGMVRDRDAAADCVQDAFCTAAVQLPKLRDPDKLRPWLYAIARNEALRCLRQRRREQVVDELPETASGDAGPDTLAARTELASLIAQAAGGLSDRDRSVLELAYRHGLDGPELAQALGVSAGNATKMVSRLRQTIERSLGALLVARRAQRNPRGCSELRAILTDWDGQFTVLVRKRIARHIDECPTCEENRRESVNPAVLLGATPILIPAPWWLRGQTLSQIQLTAAEFALGGSSADASQGREARNGGGDETRSLLDGRRRQASALGAVALIAVIALMLVWLRPHHVSVSPADLTGTAPKPTPAASLAPAAPSPAPPPTAAPSNPAPLPPPEGTKTTVPVATVAPTEQPSPVQMPAPVTIQCPNGVTVPAGQVCPAPVMTLCPNGSSVPVGQPCQPVTIQCPNGSSVPVGQPCQPVTIHCPNGATVPAGEGCPAPPIMCPNGGRAPAGGPCPVPPPATVRCWDGSTAASPSNCPPQIRTRR